MRDVLHAPRRRIRVRQDRLARRQQVIGQSLHARPQRIRQRLLNRRPTLLAQLRPIRRRRAGCVPSNRNAPGDNGCSARSRTGRSNPSWKWRRTCDRGSGRRRRSDRGTPWTAHRPCCRSGRPGPGECPPANALPRRETRSRWPRIDSLKPLLRMQARFRQQIARQMFDDELIVGDIRIQSANDIIAIVVGVGDGVIELVAARLGVAHQIEPVTAPALAEVRRTQQAIHDLLDGVGGVVARETPRPRPEIGGKPIRSKYRRRRSVRLSASFAGDKALSSSRARMKRSSGSRGHGIFRTVGGVCGRIARQAQWSRLRWARSNPAGRRGLRRRLLFRPGRSHANPRRQIGDGRIGQLAARRHLQFDILVADGLKEPAFVRLAGNESRAAVAAGEQAPPDCPDATRRAVSSPWPSDTSSSAAPGPDAPSSRRTPAPPPTGPPRAVWTAARAGFRLAAGEARRGSDDAA